MTIDVRDGDAVAAAVLAKLRQLDRECSCVELAALLPLGERGYYHARFACARLVSERKAVERIYSNHFLYRALTLPTG